MKTSKIVLSVIYLVLMEQTIAQNCQQTGCAQGLCCSKFGHCGSSPEHCAGQNPQPSPPPGNNNNGGGNGIQRKQFDCIFDSLDSKTRDLRWQGLQEALAQVTFKPQNQNELMIFLAHVSHETDGLKTLVEYCAQRGECINNYQESWCKPIEAKPGKYYYGRGWFQLSYPCNYYNAGNALGVNLLDNPDEVANSQKLACASALWYWNAREMAAPARQGNFGATTKIINSRECGGTPEQQGRIAQYQKVRKCFGLAAETQNLSC